MQTKRDQLKDLWESLLKYKQSVILDDVPVKENCDKWEVIANLTLAYRHLEDCIMRLWKVIQADAWGVSVYDKPVKKETENCTDPNYCWACNDPKAFCTTHNA